MFHVHVKFLLIPPMLIVLVMLWGFCFWHQRRRAFWSMLVACLLLLGLSLDPVAYMLAMPLQSYPALQQIQFEKDTAIVVLGGGRDNVAPEYHDRSVVNSTTLERLHYAAYLAHQTHLPILTSGGKDADEPISQAEAMQQTLQQDFKVAAPWVETTSRTTQENADFSLALLRQNHIKKIYLVTHAMHMPRSMRAFRNPDILVVAAPTMFIEKPVGSWWMPNFTAFARSAYAMYEYEGLVWYILRYRR